MTASLGEIIEGYLTQYGWSFHADGSSCWMTGWQSEIRSYPLIITLNDTFLSLTVSPLIKLGVDWDCWPEIMRFILELNNDSRMVKIGIDEFGDLTLNFSMFANRLNFEDFSDAIGIIGYYAEHLYDELYKYLDSVGFEWKSAPIFLT